MFSSIRSMLIAGCLLVSVTGVFGDDTQSSSLATELAAADRLYRAGKFAEAETGYQALLKNDAKSVPAQVGLVRSWLRQQKVDEAFETVNAALTQHPDSAALLAAKGDVQFRRAEMADAEFSYLAAKKLDHKEVHAYLGLAQIYRSYSMYGIAYGELQIAHDVAPDDNDVKRAWLSMVPRKERLAALQSYLSGAHLEDEEEIERMTDRLEFLKTTADKPVHACNLISKVEQTETRLETLHAEENRRRRAFDAPLGAGLSANVNDQNVRLLLDTGASGIVVSRAVAERAGLTRISAVHFAGIGDKGPQTGYLAVANDIRIGELEFQDCLVTVSNQRAVAEGDGLIGADVFGDYLIDIDFPEERLKLFPLPKRPEDAVAPKWLNSEALNSDGEEQGNAERKESGGAEPAGKAQKSSAAGSETSPQRPRDRYIAPEMANWTKVFRFGHMMLVPTSVNDSKPMLFVLDTGAFSNLLSLRAARQVAKVGSDYRDRIKGISGTVNQVYSSKKATLSFGHFRQSNLGIVTLDLSNASLQTGTEVSGFLGFEMLRRLELKLDYRDGLVDFEYKSR